MAELAAGAVGAVEILVELLAHFGLVILRHVFLLQLEISMGEGAGVLVFAASCQPPVFADFSLVLDLERLRVLLDFLGFLIRRGGHHAGHKEVRGGGN